MVLSGSVCYDNPLQKPVTFSIAAAQKRLGTLYQVLLFIVLEYRGTQQALTSDVNGSSINIPCTVEHETSNPLAITLTVVLLYKLTMSFGTSYDRWSVAPEIVVN